MGDSHRDKMKVLIALACVIAATSALPYILLDDGEPTYRVKRQLEPQGFKRPVLKRQDQFVDQYEDDLDSAADTPYGAAPVGRVKIQVTVDPAKEKVMTYSHHGAIITPSQ